MLERAERVFPPIEEVRPGIWSLPLPIPGPLVYVYTYAVALDDGLLLVDGGWDSDEAFAALHDGVRAIGADLGDVRGMLFTHSHPDHYGLAGRVVEASGAWTALHAADAEALERLRDMGDAMDQTTTWLSELGVPPDERAGVQELLRDFRSRPAPPAPTRTIADGDVFDVRGDPLVVMHTPGHSAGHVCLVHRAAGVVFAGDHVLSGTTPNVSAYPDSPPNPLGDYLDSLHRVLPLGDLVTLPGHEQRVPIAPRALQIVAHHDEQLRSVREIVGDGGATVAEIARRMRWAFPWEALGAGDRYFAMGEALAHVIVLQERGEIARTSSTPMRWEVAS